MKFIEMKQKDIKTLKEKIWLQNDKKCPVLDKEIELQKAVVDHIHKRKNEHYSESKGTVREVLDFRVNAVLGKLENSLKRSGLANEEDFDIVQFLINAAEYFRKGAYIDENGYYYVHPNEVPKEPKLKKSSYNKLKKIYSGRAKFPEYPKSKKLTQKLKKLFQDYELEPEFYAQ